MSNGFHLRMSRRAVLRGGLAAGTGLLLRRPALAADPTAQPLITKVIPRTGEHLPAIGLGTDKFRTSERAAIQAVIRRMQQMGGTVIDTSADYGDSETVIGDSLAALGIRDRLFLATKLVAAGAGLFRHDVAGEQSFERSLKRLRTRRIDLLQVHNLAGVDALMPMMQEWKKAGRIRYIGITTSRVRQHGQMLEYMRKYPLDFIQVNYSIADRDAARKILPLAMQRGMAVLINLPFGFGSTLQRAQQLRLPQWAAEIDVSGWPQLLLKYVISHPAVTCAIPGTTNVQHLAQDQEAARGRLPDAALRRKMEQYWDQSA